MLERRGDEEIMEQAEASCWGDRSIGGDQAMRPISYPTCQPNTDFCTYCSRSRSSSMNESLAPTKTQISSLPLPPRPGWEAIRRPC